jgi:phosphoglycerate kinase
MVRTLDDLDAAGAAVGVRVDINSPIAADGSLADDTRLRAHVDTLDELASRDARVVVLAHQGRPGGEDFTTLAAHASRLDDLLDAPVDYLDATFGTTARDAVDALAPGHVLLLENTRFYSEEVMSFPPSVAAETHLVEGLAPALDAYVNDAFAAAHRSQPSLVGFPVVVPGYAGRLMERELDALGDIGSTPTPRAYVLGGAKVDDSIDVAASVLESGLADTVLTSGVVGNTFLHASGVELGVESTSVVKDRAGEALARAEQLLDEYGEQIRVPVDVAVERDGERVEVPVEDLPTTEPAMDVGSETVGVYGDLLADTGTAILNGPAGVFEMGIFAVGTKELYRAAQAAEYTVVGGGDTASALRQLGLSGFDHVSTGGGAALTLLTGESLPAVEALS